MPVSRLTRGVALTACAVLALTATACSKDEKDSSGDTTAAPQVRLYGTDGNMQNSFGKEFPDQVGILSGMKGTTPLTPLPQDFKDRLHTVDPKLNDFTYAAESYDAVVISALAAQLAGSTEPAKIARQINGVTTTGQRCDTAAACLKLARSGIDIEYRGISLTRGGFTTAGEPSTASYGTLHFNDSDQIDEAKTEFVGAGDETTASTAAPPAPQKEQTGRSNRKTGAPLKLGGLLPKTGDLALAYPPMITGALLGVKDVNAAGGVLGEPVEWIDGDDGTNPEVAKATVAQHVADGVQVIIGAGASGISRTVLPDVVAAGLVLFSPCNTDAGLSTIEDKGLYFRTAPSDILQGRALADVILRDGPHKIVLVARKDSYGQGLQGYVRAELERAGIGVDSLKLLTYDPPPDGNGSTLDFSAGAEEIKNYQADAVLVIGYGESAQVIKALLAAGVEIQH
ncbi:ABC transporter substrate-binding protein [Plantactinospora sp. KBS50]|uniref:ABC transporter substrate-binding protein n=1 Tax=Plantactinospora sp. KBS50 TaxID=2024580 RepID=UPI000BAABBEC|nr:ABC transporter substrate-binding protein [Plantactinospora sp. KBS50]ASW53084.1 branched-chain amino acid ABC transporter substrate-binding protein [Plantactinospora sp. KBS50]